MSCFKKQTPFSFPINFLNDLENSFSSLKTQLKCYLLLGSPDKWSLHLALSLTNITTVIIQLVVHLIVKFLSLLLDCELQKGRLCLCSASHTVTSPVSCTW